MSNARAGGTALRSRGRAPNRAARRRGARARPRWIVPTAIVATLLAIAGIGALIQSQRVSSGANAVTNPAHATGPGGAEVLGPADAPVLVEEYGDYQCPACGRFAREVAPQIRTLAEQGRIRFAYHPIAFLGPESTVAANAAVCAADEGRFWDFHEYLFANQFPENSGALTPEHMMTVGNATGTTGSGFASCVQDARYTEWVGQQTDRAFANGVHSTPTVLVNGHPLDDPFQAMAAIQAALAGSS